MIELLQKEINQTILIKNTITLGDIVTFPILNATLTSSLARPQHVSSQFTQSYLLRGLAPPRPLTWPVRCPPPACLPNVPCKPHCIIPCHTIDPTTSPGSLPPLPVASYISVESDPSALADVLPTFPSHSGHSYVIKSKPKLRKSGWPTYNLC